MTQTDLSGMRMRERAEIDRSATEAKHLDEASLVFTPQNIARYVDPPADTCFPHEYCFHLLGDVRGKTVFDFGCGNGENTLMLTLRGARVVSMDISTALIEIARRRMVVNGVSCAIGFFAGSAHAVALPDESVDVVFGIAILHHLDLSLAAGEVRRVLRPGGRAIFLEPVRNSPALARLRALIPYRSPDISPFERPLTDAELTRFGAGFRRSRGRAFALPYMGVAGAFRPLQWLVDPLFRIDAALLRRFPSLSYWATVRVLELVK